MSAAKRQDALPDADRRLASLLHRHYWQQVGVARAREGRPGYAPGAPWPQGSIAFVVEDLVDVASRFDIAWLRGELVDHGKVDAVLGTLAMYVDSLAPEIRLEVAERILVAVANGPGREGRGRALRIPSPSFPSDRASTPASRPGEGRHG